MKRIFAGLAIVTAMAACNNNNSNKEAEIQQAKQHTIDSMQNAAIQQDAEAKRSVSSNTTARHYSSGTTSRNGRTTVYRSYSEPATLPTAQSHDRPGWSNKAKGAVIGGVVGAVTGAAVSKEKKGKGAVIGGVVGAAGGYGVGAILDKKKGH